ENIAEAVWQTLTDYGILQKVTAFMLDNATNNDTFIEGISTHCKKEGVYFNAEWARLHCMPHTIHLAALKLLESIGAISGPDAKKASDTNGNYQDSVNAPILHEADELDALQGDDLGEIINETNVLTSVSKAHRFILFSDI
ncbi:hypothetical protein BDQ17DRAFT_1258415, partial [Cyathus striatus]